MLYIRQLSHIVQLVALNTNPTKTTDGKNPDTENKGTDRETR